MREGALPFTFRLLSCKTDDVLPGWHLICMTTDGCWVSQGLSLHLLLIKAYQVNITANAKNCKSRQGI